MATPHTQPDDTDPPRTDEQTTPEAPDRHYVRVRPTSTLLDVATVTAQIRRLHQLEAITDSSGLLGRLRSQRIAPTFECLLIASGGDATVEYYIGVEPAELLPSFTRVLRGLFPDTYEFDTDQEPSLERVDFGHTDESADTHTAIEYLGVAERRNDWQTQLTPFESFHEADDARVPLATVVEVMAESDIPLVYQALFRPKPDWSDEAEYRQYLLERGEDTFSQRVFREWFGLGRHDHDRSERKREDRAALDRAAASRIDELAAREPYRSFDVNARFVVLDGSAPADTIIDLRTALGHVSKSCYELTGRVRTGEDTETIVKDLQDRTLYPPNYDRFQTKLPWTKNTSRGIVADANELGSFFLLGGDALTAAGSRAIDPTPGEQTTLPRPPVEQLRRYQTEGLTLGVPLTADGHVDDAPVSLPPELQPLHVAWFGKTGSGKSTSLVNAMLANHAATDGASILIDPKGDGMPVEYLRAHYAQYGSLENIYYFDCLETLPALSFFDIRDDLEAGVDRSTAVTDIVDHYIEILIGIMGQERFERAVRSPDIIQYLVKALFDPVHGNDAYGHRDLQEAVRQMHDNREAPPVTDDVLAQMLGGIVTNSPRSFDELMQGVANRIEKIPLDDRLAQLFDHVPTHPDDPRFDFRDVLDENAVVLVDTGGLRTESQRVLTLVLLSKLWTALRRRTREATTGHSETAGDSELPLVNLYLEEASSVATSGLLSNLLARSRSFGLSVTLSMQFPAQLRATDHEAYAELLNNVSTVVTGNVSVDRDLAERLATDDMDSQTVGTRLRALRRGQWFVSLPAGFDDPEPRPFLVGSVPLPSGHPEGDDPLSAARQAAFDARLDVVCDTTRREAGLDLAVASRIRPPTSRAFVHGSSAKTADGMEAQREASTAVDEVDTDALYDATPTSKSIFGYTKRIPDPVTYDPERDALVCTDCLTPYDPTIDGMRHAVECCNDLDDVDRDDVPICSLNLKLTPEERIQSNLSNAQLRFLQAVYTAHQLQYDPLEYDLLSDSMIRLQEYVDVENEAIQQLLDDGLLTKDCDYPHRLYTVTPEGRDAIGVRHREGVAYGDGKGDLSESSLHVVMVELARRFIVARYVDDPDSPIVSAKIYFEDDHDNRLDAVGLDRDGNVVVTAEAERINNDVGTAVPDDYDKMAAHDPVAAIWVVLNRDAAHDLLQALNDPVEGETRIEKIYSRSSPPQKFKIDRPGLTDVYTLQSIRNTIETS